MFIVTKYKGQWAVLDTKTGVYYFRRSKRVCEKLAKELNDLCK